MNAIFLSAIMIHLLSAAPLAPPPNDECAEAIAIAGEGEFLFINTAATITGPPEMCEDFPWSSDGLIQADVWYCWTANCSGPVTIDTCGSTAADTKMAIYEGCDCPTESYLTCADNDCADQSILEFWASQNQNYLIRIGSWPRTSGEGDTFRITCREYVDEEDAPGTSCHVPYGRATYRENCDYRSHWDALNSTRDEYGIVDDFVPEKKGSITRVCWAGAYLDNGEECIRYVPDEFEVTYYEDDCGSPGAVLGKPFSQAIGTLSVSGPFITSIEFPGGAQEFEYGADHAPVEVKGGQTYWIGITNSSSGSCGWYWETTPKPKGYALRLDETNGSSSIVKNDLAFCTDVRQGATAECLTVEVPNDYCAAATPLAQGDTPFSTAGAWTDGSFPYSSGHCYFGLNDELIHKDIWFSLDEPCSGTLQLSICESDFDARIAVYEDIDCQWHPYSPVVMCGDDECGLEELQPAGVLLVSPGHDYKIRVGGYDKDWGIGIIRAHYVPGDDSSLREFAALANCFTGSCQSCMPSSPTCCGAQDFDADGDVDASDAHRLIEAVSGPD